MSGLSHFVSWKKTKRSLPASILRVAVTFLIVYLLVVIGLLACEDWILFRPSGISSDWRLSSTKTACKDIFLKCRNGDSIHARWFPCPGSNGAVLFCHPNNGNLSIHLTEQDVQQWHDQIGVSVMIFDYPGYGRSEGVAGEEGCYQSAHAAFQWLQQNQSLEPGKILICGKSLGTAVAVELASKVEHRALILIAPFTSLPDVAGACYPILPGNLLMRNRFDSLSRIEQCKKPLLIVHGTADRRVPISLGARLFKEANEPKEFVRVVGATHNNSVMADFYFTLKRFLREQVSEK